MPAEYYTMVKVTVTAVQRTTPLKVNGTTVANVGDWEVTSGSGESFILTDVEFQKTYTQVVKESAESAAPLSSG